MSSVIKETPFIPSKDAVFTAHANAEINAPASKVYGAIIDTATWRIWSTFVPAVSIESHKAKTSKTIMTEGCKMTFNVHMKPSVKTVSKETCSLVSPPPKADDPVGTVYRICWKFTNSTTAPAFLIRAERVNEIEKLDDGRCSYRSWQTFGSMGAKVLKRTLGATLQDRLEDWVRDCKKFAEEGPPDIMVETNMQDAKASMNPFTEGVHS